MQASDSAILPQHIAIVMDGNGRWAKQRHLPAAAGHKVGVETVRATLRHCRDAGVNNLTLFAFSSENWSRPRLEVKALMALFSNYLDSEIAELNAQQVRVRFIGRRDRLSPALLKKVTLAETLTVNNRQFNLSLAVDYGGQWDITHAVQQLAQQVEAGTLKAADISAELLASELSLAELPAPDLMIRTSGEYRISNFLLWQLAYAELYFSDVLWPDFSRADLDQALHSFARRDRRFGGRKGDVIENANE